MPLMYRMFVTNGDMVSVLPIMQEIVAIVREITGVPIHAWSGSNGYVSGTAAIPLGAIVAEIQLQLARGDDWLSTFKWANEFASLCKETMGIETSVMHSIFGVLGALRMLTGFNNAGAVDKHRLALDANPEYLAKFYEGMKCAVTGSVTQRHLVKIA